MSDQTESALSTQYDRVARLLHSVMALAIIFNLAGGLLHEAIEPAFAVMPLHKATGVTVLFLALARLAWRLSHPVPPLPAELPTWQKAAARTSHLLFYGFMLLVPLTGWIATSAGNYPLRWFGLFDIPKFAVHKNDPIVQLFRPAHTALAYGLTALLLLHVAAALRHHFVLRDGVLRRMF